MCDRIGTDLVSIARVRSMVDRCGQDLLHRLLTPREFHDSGGGRGDVSYHAVAGRIAAKEAVFKLFHEGSTILPWLDIEIRRSPSGALEPALRGKAAELAASIGLGRVALSTSHDGDYAVAFATASLHR
ncbi:MULTISPECIES: holo-ACP synthase [unclassified Streptomyces]|uniref:holo-ACP synthase n=1 Tax=unclassified Streptomyces TaxID=2593676 RepID=UPI002E1A2B3D|nr:holo-ACP synthase [Streptomyces sp. NBC_01023]